FVEHDWSLKALHRLIVTSSTYRISTQNNPRYASEDPENRLMWRMPYRRLEVEVIRDAILAASGRLNRQMYGPSMFPFIPPAAVAPPHSAPRVVGTPPEGVSPPRRTVYAFPRRPLFALMLEFLALCDPPRPPPGRSMPNAPPQPPPPQNSDFANRQSRYLAER